MKRKRERKKLLPKMCFLDVKKRLFFASKRKKNELKMSNFETSFYPNSARHKKAHNTHVSLIYIYRTKENKNESDGEQSRRDRDHVPAAAAAEVFFFE